MVKPPPCKGQLIKSSPGYPWGQLEAFSCLPLGWAGKASSKDQLVKPHSWGWLEKSCTAYPWCRLVKSSPRVSGWGRLHKLCPLETKASEKRVQLFHPTSFNIAELTALNAFGNLFEVEGERGRETGRKGGGRCTGGGRRGGGKRDSQGGGKREKKGKIRKIAQYLAIKNLEAGANKYSAGTGIKGYRKQEV